MFSWKGSLRTVVVSRTVTLLVLVVAVLSVAGSLAVSAADALPDGWGYELVSPADTSGRDINFGAAGVDGDHAWVDAFMPFSDAQSSGNEVTYAARRTPAGWSLQDLGRPKSSKMFAIAGRSGDGERTIVQTCSLTIISCFSGGFAFERIEPDGTRTTMFSTQYAFAEAPPFVVGVSDDASWMFFQPQSGQPPYVPEDTHVSGQGLYASHDGAVEYVGFDENGDVLPCGASLAHDGNGVLVGTGFEQSGVSADGGTVAFESPNVTSGCPDPVDVYVRRGGVSRDISRPASGPDQGSQFAGATRDGEVTFILTTNQLTNDDPDSGNDLYSYTWSTGQLELISQGLDIDAAAISPNGDYIYIRSSDSLAGQGTDGAENFYVYHGGSFRFIASTLTGDFRLGGAIASLQATVITPDGREMLFYSDDPFGTGLSTGGTLQIFQYRYADNSITCISCPPDGEAPTTPTQILSKPPDGNIDQRYQSDDGSTVTFDSHAALVPGDVNDKADVYLWRRGLPLELVSSGHSQTDSSFSGMSADGHSVFFEATDRLVQGVDQDNKKLYVARFGGGFPQPPVVARCEDDACRGSLATAPALLNPASTTFAGVGNAKPAVVKKVVARRLTRGQKLKGALKKCKAKRKRSQRKKCESSIRKSFGRGK